MSESDDLSLSCDLGESCEFSKSGDLGKSCDTNCIRDKCSKGDAISKRNPAETAYKQTLHANCIKVTLLWVLCIVKDTHKIELMKQS